MKKLIIILLLFGCSEDPIVEELLREDGGVAHDLYDFDRHCDKLASDDYPEWYWSRDELGCYSITERYTEVLIVSGCASFYEFGRKMDSVLCSDTYFPIVGKRGRRVDNCEECL